MVNDRLNKLIDNQNEKLQTLQALKYGLKWFIEHFGNLNIVHQDLRGNDITPTIILATEDEVYIPLGILVYFEQHKYYPILKKYLVSFGTTKHDGKTYFYIQSNVDLKEMEDVKEIMFNRSNKELFPHIDKYFA